MALALAGLAGCSDRRGDLVREFVATNPPEDVVLVEVTGEFRIEAVGDGVFRTNVPVLYRTTRETVTISDGFRTEAGAPLAARLDAVRDWAEDRLPAGDRLRTAVERTWEQARYGFLLKQVEVPVAAVLPALVSVRLQPTAEGEWVIEESGNTLDVPGVAVVRPEIPVEGTEGAERALAEVEVVAEGLEKMRADWLAEFERRAAAAAGALRDRLATGVAYEGTVRGQAARMVVSRGADRGDEVVAVMTTPGTPQAAVRLVGGVARTEEGGAVWRAERVAVISGGRGELDVVDAVELRAEGEGLVGDGVSFPRGEAVDLIPEI